MQEKPELLDEIEALEICLKKLNKKEDYYLGIIGKLKYIYEKDGKWYWNNEARKKYWYIRDRYLDKIGQEIISLEKKIEDLWIESGYAEYFYFYLIDLIRPILNGKPLYTRILIRRIDGEDIY